MHGKGGSPVVGLVLIAIGTLFLLDTLDILSNNVIGTYWPVLLIAVGFSGWITSGRRPNLGNVIVITLGVLFLVEKLVDDVRFSDLWPVLIIVIGFNIVLNRGGHRKKLR